MDETIEYWLSEELPDQARMDGILRCYEAVFAETDRRMVLDELRSRRHILQAALRGDQVVGFKLGYARRGGRFYSWLGGVSPDYRGQGIARELMRRQHRWVNQSDYVCLRTVTEQRFAAMLQLNLSEGFVFIGAHSDATGKLRLIMERRFRLDRHLPTTPEPPRDHIYEMRAFDELPPPGVLDILERFAARNASTRTMEPLRELFAQQRDPWLLAAWTSEDHQLAAFCTLRALEPQRALLSVDRVVHPDFRDHRLDRALLRRQLERAHDLGYPRAELQIPNTDRAHIRAALDLEMQIVGFRKTPDALLVILEIAI